MLSLETFVKRYKKYEFPKYGYVKLPTILITDEERAQVGCEKVLSNYDFLRFLVWQGFQKYVPKGEEEAYKNRVVEELALLTQLGFVDYILLVWKVYAFCWRNGIATGLGRGSAPSLLLFFLLKITKVDSIKYKLVLQRFISSARMGVKEIDGETYLDGALLCDYDLDLSSDHRHLCVEYLKKEFPGRVSKIANISRNTSKKLIKDVYKCVEEVNEEAAKDVSNLIDRKFGVVPQLQDVYNDSPRFKEFADNHKKVYDIACKLQDTCSNFSSHASGFLISSEPLDESIPLMLSKTEEGDDLEICAVYDKNVAENLAIKLDLLGVRCVSVIDDILKETGEDVDNINLDSDPIIYNALQDPHSKHGIFQLSQDATFRVAQKCKPRCLNDLAVVTAASRPGAFQFADKFADYKNKGVYESIHPFFDDILKETGGVPMFQEQLLFMANKVGFSLTESEIIRKIVGKKLREKMIEWEEKIKDKVKENNLPSEVGDILWNLANSSADYSFNKCAHPDTIVEERHKGNIPMSEVKIGDTIRGFDFGIKEKIWVDVKNIYNNEVELFEFCLEDGSKLRLSMDHKVLCGDGEMRRIQDAFDGGYEVIQP